MKMKTIIEGVSAVVVVAAMLVTAIWASRRPVQTPCAWIKVEVTDSLQRRFVKSNELCMLLQREGLSPVGKRMDAVSCQAIEDCLLGHDMIRTAECYKSANGGVCVRVTQRVPALFVRSNDGNYYVDEDRKIMPVRATIEVDVPVFRGAVGKRAATEEYYDFAQWLVANRYWKSRIKHVHVHNTKHLVLAQHEVKGDIILGELEGYEKKMDRLQKLYTKGFDKIGYTDYREYDLRFDGQVVGRR